MQRTHSAGLIAIVALSAITVSSPAQRSRVSEPPGIEGLTEPWKKVEVAAPESGLVMHVDVQEGDVVRKGQVIARLDDLVLRAELRVAEAQKDAVGQLQIVEAEFKLRDTRHAKLEALQQKGHATAEEVLLALSEKEVAQARLQQARETLRVRQLEYERTQAQIERRMIRSPINGVVTRVYRQPSEFVSFADPAIATVVQLDPLLAVLTVYPDQIRDLQVGESVEVTLESSRTKVRGAVTFISPVLDAESGTLQIKVRIPNKNGQHRSGDTCTLVTAEHSNRIGSRPAERR